MGGLEGVDEDYVRGRTNVENSLEIVLWDWLGVKRVLAH